MSQCASATRRSYLSVSAMETKATIRKRRRRRPRDVAATATRSAARPTRPPCTPVTSHRRPMTSSRPHFRTPPPSVSTVDDVDQLPHTDDSKSEYFVALNALSMDVMVLSTGDYVPDGHCTWRRCVPRAHDDVCSERRRSPTCA